MLHVVGEVSANFKVVRLHFDGSVWSFSTPCISPCFISCPPQPAVFGFALLRLDDNLVRRCVLDESSLYLRFRFTFNHESSINLSHVINFKRIEEATCSSELP